MKTVFKRFLLFFLCATFATALVLMPIQPSMPVYAEEPEVEYWAVIVGISDYQYVSDLSYCDSDARELSHQLSPFWGEDHIRLLTNDKATKANVEDAITDWLAISEDADDVVLIFFSGHGGWEFLEVYDSLTYSYENDIFGDELDSWLDVLDSEKIIVIIDSCVSGSWIRELKRKGRIILTACSPGEDAWDDYTLEHGVLSYYILEALGDFEATDANDNYEVSIEEIFEYARPRTTNYTEAKPVVQHPLISDNYEGELNLLMKVTAGVEPDMAEDINILSTIEKTYSPAELPVSFTWASASSHDFEAVSPVSGGNGIRYVFTSWDDGNTSASRTISQGGVYTANYKTQYYLTIESAYGDPEGQGWYDAGSTVTISVASIEEATTKHIFTGWSGDLTGTAPTTTLTINSAMAVTANWRTEYLLTVESAYGDPTGGGWYDSGSLATISVTSPEGVIIRQVFTGWSGDFSATTPSASVIMDEPKAVIASWRTDYAQLYMLIGGVVVLVGVISFIVIRMLMKRKPGTE